MTDVLWLMEMEVRKNQNAHGDTVDRNSRKCPATSQLFIFSYAIDFVLKDRQIFTMKNAIVHSTTDTHIEQQLTQ